jgi:hypothetical protein
MKQAHLETIAAGIHQKCPIASFIDGTVRIAESALNLVAIVQLYPSFIYQGRTKINRELAIASSEHAAVRAPKGESLNIDA